MAGCSCKTCIIKSFRRSWFVCLARWGTAYAENLPGTPSVHGLGRGIYAPVDTDGCSAVGRTPCTCGYTPHWGVPPLRCGIHPILGPTPLLHCGVPSNPCTVACPFFSLLCVSSFCPSAGGTPQCTFSIFLCIFILYFWCYLRKALRAEIRGSTLVVVFNFRDSRP